MDAVTYLFQFGGHFESSLESEVHSEVFFCFFLVGGSSRRHWKRGDLSDTILSMDALYTILLTRTISDYIRQYCTMDYNYD